MSLNLENIGRKIAIVKNNPKLKNTSICVNENVEDVLKPYDNITIDQGTFQLCPDKNADRQSIYICGPAGAGKSVYAGNYMQEYRKTFKDAPIYIFSEGKEDPALDKVKDVKRIPLDDDLLQNPIQWTDFEGPCLVVFDDTDALKGAMYKYIYDLRDKLLSNARKQKVSVITTNHTCTGPELKKVLGESQVIVFFMMNYNRALKYLIENYVGLNKKGIQALKSKRTRAVAFIKTYPNCILTEREVLTINKLQDF